MDDTADKPDLLNAIDDAAVALLALAKGDCVEVSEDGSQRQATLSERVKAFSAVSDWCRYRVENQPKSNPEGAKFSAIRDAFHGNSNGAPLKRGRGRPPKPKPDLEPTPSPADPDSIQ